MYRSCFNLNVTHRSMAMVQLPASRCSSTLSINLVLCLLRLKVAKILTCLSAIVMAAVFIGTVVQIVEENTPTEDSSQVTTAAPHPSTRPPTSSMLHLADSVMLNDGRTTTPAPEIQLPMSVTTLYSCIMVGIFIITGLMHLDEFYCLFHGIWYLFCLPAGNLILMIYSICNMTDRSWGT